MKTPKRLIILLIAAALLLSGCGGSGKASDSSGKSVKPKSPASEAAKSGAKISLPIAVNDTLNPYTAKSKMNQEITQLMFNGLISLNENYEPQYILAESVTRNGKQLTIKLKNAQFSDGTRVTAEDVTYSITAAQKSATSKYKAQLAGITGKNAASQDTLTINISKPDEFFINLLDFPIIKRNSDNVHDEDKQLLPPVGSGMYIYEKSDSIQSLKANTAYSFEKPNISEISLVSTPDEDSLRHNITTGSISIYYTDLSDGALPSMNGAVSTVPLNSLIFLGANTKTGPMKTPEIRKAVSAAIDRSTIAKKAYLTYAYPAAGPYHPHFAAGAPAGNSLSEKADINFSVAELAKAGYNSKDTDGYYITSAKKRLSLKLIVNKENAARVSAANLIISQLAKAGIEVKLSEYSFAEYENAINSGSFDLYLAEMRFGNNMDLSPLILQGSTSGYFPQTESTPASSAAKSSSPSSSSSSSSGSLPSNSASSASQPEEEPEQTSAEIYSKLIKEEATVAEFVTVFNNELPVIPLCYRSGIIAAHLIFTEKLTPGAGNIFAGFGDLILK